MLGNLIRKKNKKFTPLWTFWEKYIGKNWLNKHSFDSENFKQLRGNHNKPYNPKILKVFNLTDPTRAIKNRTNLKLWK